MTLRSPSAVTIAAFSIDPPSSAGLSMVTWKLNVTDVPAATVPTVNVTCGGGPVANTHAGEHDPPTNVAPGGITSVTTTFVAGTTLVGLETTSV